MKKIFTLITAAFLTIAVFAAERKPQVTLKSNRAYQVIIDGKSYLSSNTMNLSAIRSGQHSIKVYEVNNSRFRKFKKLVSATTFQVRNKDVDITVNSRGQINITEDRFGYDKKYDKKESGWDKKDFNDRDDHGNEKNKRF